MEGKAAKAAAAAVIFALALTVPLQYLVRREVVVGLPAESAHSHAHGGEGDTHIHAGAEGEQAGHEGEHAAEEGPQPAEVPLGVNLIPNFGFEVGTREQAWGWVRRGTGEGETVYRDGHTARSGLASAAVTTNGAVVGRAAWVTRLDELPMGYVVTAKGYVRTEGLEGGAFLQITLETRKEGEERPLLLGWASSDTVAGDSDWTLVSVSVTVPPQATGVWLEVGLSGRGRAWFDDLSLVAEEAA